MMRHAVWTCALFLAAACGDPAFRGTAVQPPKEIEAIEVVLHDGRSISLSAGKPTLIFFGFTQCPDVCPTTLQDWSRIRDRMGDRADDAQFVFVSVDTERDTASIANDYAAKFDRGIIGVTPDSATLRRLQQAFDASSFVVPAGSGHAHTMSHSSQTFLLDGKGRLVAFFPYGSGWDVMLHDVEKLL